MTELLLKEESYEIIGLCMEVHRQLGPGFQEAIYKDALEHELKEATIPYEREKGFQDTLQTNCFTTPVLCRLHCL